MKGFLAFLFSGIALLLSSCSASPALSENPHYATVTYEESPFQAVVASDLHYISPRLHDEG